MLAFDLLDLELPGQLPWSRADLGRLVAGDERTWDRALVLIARTVETLRIVYMLATLEIDAVRDHVEDTLMADECRRLREVRDPAKFGAYVRAVAGNRAIYIVKRRVSVLPLSDAAANALVFVGVSPPSAVFTSRDGLGTTGLVPALLRLRDALSKKQFRVLWLKHVEGFSMVRIARALGVAPQAISKMHAAAISAISLARSSHSTSEGGSDEPGHRPPPPPHQEIQKRSIRRAAWHGDIGDSRGAAGLRLLHDLRGQLKRRRGERGPGLTFGRRGVPRISWAPPHGA